ncbi:MAG: hypothetical protein DRJ61_16855, partial [Acidobacteria bacterium]
SSGSIYYASAPYFTFNKNFSSVAHGLQSISWQSLGIDPADVLLDIYIIQDGKETLLASNINGTTFNWDTLLWPDGVYEIRLVFRSAKTGEILKEQRESLSINNSLVWHTGTITTNEVWQAGIVHAVDGELVIDGSQLTIITGAVVKFLHNASITAGDSSALVFSGSAEAPVYLTAMADDSIGGDNNLDGDASVPEPGDWSGILLNITATLTENDYVYYRYMKTGHSGELTQSQVWPSKILHSITGNVTVPDGVTLTIAAGAIVKFNEDTQIIVNSGGRINVNGSVAQPVIITSYRDDTAGGDSNGDGNQTTAAAGDWHWILLNGGRGVFNQCELRYGGGPALGGWGPSGGPGKATIKTYGSANLVVSNAIVRDSYYDGILSWGGPVTIVNSIFTGIDRAICAHPGSLVTVVNCTLDDNRVGLLLHGGILRAHNTIIYGSYTAGLLHDSGDDDVILSYCTLWNPQASAGDYSGTADQTGLRGNSITNPVFRGTGAGSYELGFLSPCIDAADTLIAPPRDNKGNPRVNNPRITPTGIPNASNIYADIGAFEFVEDAESPIDLVAINIQGDTVVTAGMQAAVSWQVANIGSSAVSGSWHDAVYLAPVTAGKWDVPVLAAQVLSTGKSAPDQPLEKSAVVRVPGGTEGSWVWQIKVNARGEIFEGRNSYNNSSKAIMPSQLHVPEFQEGVTVSNSFAGIGAAAWYKIELTSTQSVLVTLDSSADSGRCLLSAGYDAMPTVTNYDIRSAALNSPDARLTVSARGRKRTAYLRLMPEKLDGTLGYTLNAAPSVFALESIGLDTAGNSGSASIPLSGSAFGSGMSVTLRPAAGVDIVAHTVAISDATLAQAVFNLADAAPGVYSVIAALAGQTAQLPDAFTIITGSGGMLETSVIVPETVRDGRTFTGYLEYRNSGDADLPAPLLTVQGSSSGIKVWYQNASSSTLSGVSWLGVAQDSPLPAILGPGSRYTIPFRATATGVSMANFQIYILDTNDTIIMNYTALGEVMAGSTPHPLWSNAWNRFKADAGPLRG